MADERVQKSFWLDKPDAEKLAIMANEMGVSEVDIVRFALREKYDRMTIDDLRPTPEVAQ